MNACERREIDFHPYYNEIIYIMFLHNYFSDLFNLPLAALWTAVMGDWNRNVEESTEERIPVEEIIIHERFHNFQHDIGMMSRIN